MGEPIEIKSRWDGISKIGQAFSFSLALLLLLVAVNRRACSPELQLLLLLLLPSIHPFVCGRLALAGLAARTGKLTALLNQIIWYDH